MGRRRPGILWELLPVGLILACVAGTLALVLTMHARSGHVAPRPSSPVPLASTTGSAEAPAPKADPPPAPKVVEAPAPALPSPPPPPVEDPTKTALARLGASLEAERAATVAADRKAEALERARQAAAAESERWRRREQLVRAQVKKLNTTAEAIDRQHDALARERDVLVKQVDEAKAAQAKAQSSGGGYAVMPHKGPNGTWQRPVVIECRNGLAILRPRNQTFTMLDMSPLLGTRGSPLVGAVARELIKVQDLTSPDGAPIVPYIYFIVRPDGIRPYYEARARLEPLGIAFGYELVDQDWVIDFPDLDVWDNAGKPLLAQATPAPDGSPGGGTGGSAGGGMGGSGFTWPADRGPGGRKETGGAEPFLWPRTASGDPAGGQPGGIDPGAGRFGAGGLAGADDHPALPRGPGGWVPRERPMGDGNGSGLTPGNTAPPSRNLAGPGGSGVGLGGEGLAGAPGTPGGLPLVGRDERTPGGNALSRVGPEGLPGLEPTDGRPTGAGGMPAAPPGPGGVVAEDAGLAPRSMPVVPGALPRNLSPESLRALKELADAAGGGARAMPNPDGRVRLDPSLLAQLGGLEDGDEDRPPLPPTGLRPGTTGGGAALGAQAPSTTGTPGSAGSPGGMAGSPSPSTDSSGVGMPIPGGGTPVGVSGGSNLAGTGTPRSTSGPITVPLNLTVACGRDGVVIHPGGYRLSAAALKRDRGLLRHLETIVMNHAIIDPSVHPAPRLEFLVEPGGATTYEEARRQTVLSGVSWPVTIRVAESGAARPFARERF